MFFVVSLTVINILLWFVFLIRFKRLFSTDDIISSTREEMNKMIEDVNRNTERDITLINDRIKELKALIAEGDRQIAIVRTEKEKSEQYAVFSNRIASAQNVKKQTPVQKAAEQYKKSGKTFDPGNLSYSVNHDANEEKLQESLFDENPTTINVNKDGSSFAKVPLVGPEVVMSDNPIVPKISFNEQVRELNERGETVDEIARQLKRSTTEVQFAIDMGM